jgi:hypothetical protein
MLEVIPQINVLQKPLEKVAVETILKTLEENPLPISYFEIAEKVFEGFFGMEDGSTLKLKGITYFSADKENLKILLEEMTAHGLVRKIDGDTEYNPKYIKLNKIIEKDRDFWTKKKSK